MGTQQERVASLMARFRQGDPEAAGLLVDTFYPQLKQIAANRMRRELGPHTWQPTALVNELYLELVKVRALKPATEAGEDQAAFLRLSAFLMKRLLILHARPLSRQAIREEFAEDAFGAGDSFGSLQEMDDLLERLGRIDPQLRTVVELRVFEGLTGDEAAARMGCSPRTEARYWKFARNWLADALDAPGRA